jgi:Domain of unknown function (DUF4349)
VAGLALLAACSTGAGGDRHGSSSVAPAVPPDRVTASTEARPGAAGAAGANRPLVRTTSVIRTGQVDLTSRHIDAVRARVDDLLSRVGGSVDDEDTTHDSSGRTDRSTLVLRVPVDEFDTAKHALERLGRLTSSTESGKDVTTEVIDTSERAQTLQNSLDRLQRFQRSAGDVADLIRFENEITSRQGELQSLKAQQAYLSDQTSMSTITVHLSTPQTYVAPRRGLQEAGFGSGLRSGWHALGGLVAVALTVLGAALPFLVLLALVGGALRILLRRRGRRTPPTPTPTPTPTPGSP